MRELLHSVMSILKPGLQKMASLLSSVFFVLAEPEHRLAFVPWVLIPGLWLSPEWEKNSWQRFPPLLLADRWLIIILIIALYFPPLFIPFHIHPLSSAPSSVCSFPSIVQSKYSSENHAALLGPLWPSGFLRCCGERQPGLAKAQNGKNKQDPQT